MGPPTRRGVAQLRDDDVDDGGAHRVPLGDLLLARWRLQVLAQPVVDGQEQGLLLNDVLGDGLVVQIVDRAGDVAGAETGEDRGVDLEVAVPR